MLIKKIKQLIQKNKNILLIFTINNNGKESKQMVDYMSIAGSYHGMNEAKNEDAIKILENDTYLVLALSDGISSCCRSKKGAELAGRSAAEYLMRYSQSFFDMQKKERAGCLLSYVKSQLRKQASADKTELKEYSSTLSCVLLDKKQKKLMYFNVGDSLILSVQDDACRIVAMPSDSREGCISTTNSSAAAEARTGIIDIDEEKVNVVFLCSDGAWKHMYQRTRMRPEVRKMMINQDFSALREYLGSQERHDDCSFILADVKKQGERKLNE